MLRFAKTTPNRPLEVFTAALEAGPIPIPKNEVEALHEDNPHRLSWLAAMKSDMQKKRENGYAEYVSESVPQSKGMRVHKGKWAFVVKYNPDGTVLEFRARWVFCGYSQVEGRDYDDT